MASSSAAIRPSPSSARAEAFSSSAAVRGPLSYADAVEEMKSASHPFVCYEGLDVLPLPSLLTGLPERVAFLIGPEGGLSERETALAREAGIPLAGLGKRILRTETAGLAAVASFMALYGEME